MTPPPVTRRTGLNRTLLLDERQPWHGRPAGRVLGAVGLAERVQVHHPSPRPVEQPLAALDAALRDKEPWPQEVAAEWIAGLTRLLRTLTRPTDADRRAREEWDAADWDRWAAVRRFVLGGGVVAGVLGQHALADPGLRALPVELLIAADPAIAPLTGLVAATPVTGDLLVLDLGHSAVKAATWTARTRTLGPVHRTGVPWTPWDVGTWPAPEPLLALVVEAARQVTSRRETGRQVTGRSAPEAVADALAEAATEAATEPGDDRCGPRRPAASTRGVAVLEVRVSLANYVVDGVLDDDQTYGTLGRLGPDPTALLGAALTAGLDRPVRVSELVNDGQAAALAWTDQPPTAVLSVGTSLGLGFPRA